MKRILSCVALTLTVLPLSGVAEELYRYTDDNGVVVLDRQVPPRFIANGYEVLDSNGRVKQVIPPAPTAEERQAQRREQEARRKQDAEDATLLRLYSSVADLDRAQARQLQQLDNQIAVARANIAELQVERETLRSQAADLERAGRKVEQGIIDQLATVDAETRRQQQRIERTQADIEAVKADYASQRARLAVLLGVEPAAR
ncbi:DUF4124 domain-containing protein [Halopseudomonas aestusnigri]|uniref:DUF4124 domain-containing protein n=1 Tax=Halopseudomonas aestusnigri TaxID=857252 RepID=A0AAQ1G903_9GAMM|nr:DUF4124 domain-containing protein [Halopseudomonas aestusnigri]OWL88540.1 hypothetical protein B7O88_10200 [Halopseudomonas aestusnigri]SEG41909.1 protein of unknown function [Halopseudomonas aestusnigri]